MFLSILESWCHKLLIAYGLTLLTPRWEAFPTPEALSPMVPQVLGATPGFLLAYGVLGTPHGKVCDRGGESSIKKLYKKLQQISLEDH